MPFRCLFMALSTDDSMPNFFNVFAFKTQLPTLVPLIGVAFDDDVDDPVDCSFLL